MTKICAKIGNREVDLESYVLERVRIAVDNAAKQAVAYLAVYIIENWYDKYTPKIYERTYDFLRSASKTETTVSGRDKNAVVCMIYFDTSKISPRYYGPGKLNAHVDSSGASTADKIPRMIENGAWFWGRGREEGLGSMEATIKMLEKNYPKMVEKELRKMGLPFSVRMK